MSGFLPGKRNEICEQALQGSVPPKQDLIGDIDGRSHCRSDLNISRETNTKNRFMPFPEIMAMTAPPKLPVEIDSLLKLLNASDGAVASDTSLPEVSDEAAPDVSARVASEAQGVTAVEVPEIEISDDVENRFAAHIVRGMRKSRTG